MSFLQILERTFSRRFIVNLSPFLFFISRCQNTDAGVDNSIQNISNFAFNIDTLDKLFIKSLLRMETGLCRENDIAVVYRCGETLDERIVMLKAYAVAVDPSGINEFILLSFGIDLINIESVSHAEVSVDIYSVSCCKCCSDHCLFLRCDNCL